jgi:hypothetical protein
MTINNLDELYAQLMANLPAAIWAHHTRTLTNVGESVEYPAEGDPLTIYRDTTVEISLSELGDLNDVDQMWFTVKDNIEDPDDKSILQIDKNGLQYINAQPAGYGIVDGSITITDLTNGNITISLMQKQAANLPLYEAYPTRWDVKILRGGRITILNIGNLYIKGTPTRAIS